jgi:hypothetical protein
MKFSLSFPAFLEATLCKSTIRIGFVGTSTPQAPVNARQNIHLRSIEGAKAVSAMLPVMRRSRRSCSNHGQAREMGCVWLTVRPFPCDLVHWVATVRATNALLQGG